MPKNAAIKALVRRKNHLEYSAGATTFRPASVQAPWVRWAKASVLKTSAAPGVGFQNVGPF